MRLAFAFACALPLLACTDGLHLGDEPLVAPDLAGSLRVPLTTEDESGTVYRLRNVEIEITGAALLSISDRDGVRSHESLITELPAGQYTIFVRPGWRLMARDGQGNETQTPAELQSANPFTVQVNELGDQTLGLVLRQAGKQLRFGPGAGVRVTQASRQSAHPSL